jgi:hypothetical protein
VRNALMRLLLSYARSWAHKRAATACTTVGLVTSLITVIVCAMNVIHGSLSFALAVPACLTSVGGLLGLIIPDAWTAWRRGFQQGWQTAMQAQPDGLGSDIPAKARREQGQTARLGDGRPTICRLAAGNDAQRPTNPANHQAGYP